MLALGSTHFQVPGMTPQLDGPEGHLFMSVPISELSQGATVLWMQT